MITDLVAQNIDFVEQAKRFPAGCDFFKELWDLYAPHAEAATEAFRRDWVARYERGEIKIVRKILFADDGTEYKGDKNGWNMTIPACIDDFRYQRQSNAYSDVFPRCAMLPITDTHREFIVICHARRLDTEAALIEMVNYFEAFKFLREYIWLDEKEVNGVSVEIPTLGKNLAPLFRVWKRAFSYLRPTHSRWPQQKYGELWREARAAYAQARMLETSSTTELVIAGLAEALQKAQDSTVAPMMGFDERVKTLIALSEALHKILLAEKQS